ncbi:MAG TPA: hypothetical protein VLA09_08560, partial [Longimicrobiales bacterium]|nr:hypothetical protein [Longimicrobiales bacterium]
ARSTPARYPDLLRALGERRVLALGEEVLAPPLFRRLRHVVTEAARVEDAVDRLRGADFTGFGSLMDASHESLRTDFLVSSAELDELASIAREGGATGARLTGAGFGGCIVALADRQTAATVLDALGRHYYEPRGLVDGLDARAFVAVPSAGASVERSS